MYCCADVVFDLYVVQDMTVMFYATHLSCWAECRITGESVFSSTD